MTRAPRRRLEPGIRASNSGELLGGHALAGSLVVLLAALLACKSEQQAPLPAEPATPVAENPQGNAPVAAATTAEKKCAPNGAAAPCDCGGGKTGMQSCDEAVGWSKCDCPAAPALSFTLDKIAINEFDSVKLTFNQPVNPASGKHWVTVVPSGKPDSDWGEWKYVPAGATSIELTPKVTENVEIRLHDTFPDHKFGVLYRASLFVVASVCRGEVASECDCPGGVKGSKTCSEPKGWTACDCPKPKAKPRLTCVDGQTQACPCGDGTFGRRTCDRGKWPSGCFLCD
ncbi:MAG: hypothetical protein H6718_22075 [Polyangiaceae bacterium]|nr:hypothetical protein [Myxococcales bacterium]MCB9588111.1 hypothetical protein [Polyangiaceae bacterium]